MGGLVEGKLVGPIGCFFPEPTKMFSSLIEKKTE